VWAIVQLLVGNDVTLDADGRPTALYEAHGTIHSTCPRNLGGTNEATEFGHDGQCLIKLGCRGPATKAHCEKCWNGIADEAHWCIGVNAPCHGCVERSFPGPESFYERYEI
jgi:hydrogenase small subunit